METKLIALIERLEKATAKLESLSVGSGSVASTSDGAAAGPALVAFDEVISGAFAEYLAHSKTIGGLVAEQVAFQSDVMIQT